MTYRVDVNPSLLFSRKSEASRHADLVFEWVLAPVSDARVVDEKGRVVYSAKANLRKPVV